MSMAQCEEFYTAKVAQAEKHVRERYPLLQRAEMTPTVWAQDHATDLLATWLKALKIIDAHWELGEFGTDFKEAVLLMARTWMEICKRFAAVLQLKEAA